MITYRIGHKNYISQLVASGKEGRWNSSGEQVIYLAGSVALALLENMVRRQGVGFNNDFATAVVEIPDDLTIDTLAINDLPKGWRDIREYNSCQTIGSQWYKAAKTAILKVPSAVLPEENNYVVNTEHAGFKRIKLLAITGLVPDQRLEQILKNYRS